MSAFYRDWRPTNLGRLVGGTVAWLSGLGLTPHILIALQVSRSGRLRSKVLVVARHNGQRYLADPRRGFGLVQNVRAAGGEPSSGAAARAR